MSSIKESRDQGTPRLRRTVCCALFVPLAVLLSVAAGGAVEAADNDADGKSLSGFLREESAATSGAVRCGRASSSALLLLLQIVTVEVIALLLLEVPLFTQSLRALCSIILGGVFIAAKHL